MDIPSWARVGRQVVCIDDDWSAYAVGCDALGITRLPMRNEVLTIVRVGVSGGRQFEAGGRQWRELGGVWLGFAEIPDQGRARGINFPASHFRPLVGSTLEADLALFRKLLVPHAPLRAEALRDRGGPLVPTAPHRAPVETIHAR